MSNFNGSQNDINNHLKYLNEQFETAIITPLTNFLDKSDIKFTNEKEILSLKEFFSDCESYSLKMKFRQKSHENKKKYPMDSISSFDFEHDNKSYIHKISHDLNTFRNGILNENSGFIKKFQKNHFNNESISFDKNSISGQIYLKESEKEFQTGNKPTPSCHPDCNKTLICDHIIEARSVEEDDTYEENKSDSNNKIINYEEVVKLFFSNNHPNNKLSGNTSETSKKSNSLNEFYKGNKAVWNCDKHISCNYLQYLKSVSKEIENKNLCNICKFNKNNPKTTIPIETPNQNKATTIEDINKQLKMPEPKEITNEANKINILNINLSNDCKDTKTLNNNIDLNLNSNPPYPQYFNNYQIKKNAFIENNSINNNMINFNYPYQSFQAKNNKYYGHVKSNFNPNPIYQNQIMINNHQSQQYQYKQNFNQHNFKNTKNLITNLNYDLHKNQLQQHNTSGNYIISNNNINQVELGKFFKTVLNNLKNSEININESNVDTISNIQYLSFKKDDKIKRPDIEMIGDWVCYICKNLNFRFRTSCNKCGISKIENAKLGLNQIKDQDK